MKRKLLFWTLAVLILAPVVYVLFVFNWSYADGERAGWVQKFSNKGWLCKTWEGEMAMVSMPGSTSEKFPFTVWDEAIAEQINKVSVVEEIPLAPGVVVPTPAPKPEAK